MALKKPALQKTGKVAVRPARTPATPSASKTSTRASTARRKSKRRATVAKAKLKATRARRVARKRGRGQVVEIPPILLEGDTSVAPILSGPGQRYSLGPVPPSEPRLAAATPEELPEAYGTQRLLLLPCDPHRVYAHWDLTREQQRHYNRRAAHGHLVLRMFVGTPTGDLENEIHLSPDARYVFVQVGKGGTQYVAELGYFGRRDKRWRSVAVSEAALTPPEEGSPETAAQFATIPVDMPLARLVSLVKKLAAEHVPLATALEQLRAAGHRELPTRPALALEQWTPAQERALAEMINMDQVRRAWVGSLEITELVRGRVAAAQAPPVEAQITSPGPEWAGLASPVGRVEQRKGFWFNVNADVVIYGATEPDAKVTIGGHGIKLHPDGSFTVRFTLPDGQYALPVVAVSADQTEGRAAELRFSRHTEYQGQVGVQPGDAALAAPPPASAA